MGTIYRELLKQYELKQIENKRNLEERKQIIYEKIPEIARIDRHFSTVGIRLLKLISAGNDANNYNKLFDKDFKDKNTRKRELLESYNYPADFLEIQYNCMTCKDTGFLLNADGIKTPTHCKCFTQALTEMSYRSSNIGNLLKSENFSTFDLSIYSDEINPSTGISYRASMEDLKSNLEKFIGDFKTSYTNIVFHGSTGVGKTFLCNCIAKELIDRGSTVLYLSSIQLFQLINKNRFNKQYVNEEEAFLLENMTCADLLIIDDLGAEMDTSINISDLFNVINSRHTSQKSTIISTNLTSEDIKNSYSERIASRILGHYRILKIYGHDLRLGKKYNKKNIPIA
ncbi:hypothetical protein AN639_08595 [Candidatus Epulonipiscium fishelsonii]|uniref:Uncharacterized protein n=1 Tax=Candidatus Epulonipiscium fishelsonii TaxID=77094 RepID=A0ACC8X9P2_9FIRM|nr:hypothetical protein AN639_08595 [Epulopiscium sp. SCG-B05WGA-EpuloA1]ONI38795.1 hypothetical protein AN396_09935 [Epulopiscium sp. SCG-B11WGA-EpuloA1]